MAIIHEVFDAAASAATTYKLTTGDYFYGAIRNNTSDADDWIKVELKKNIEYTFGAIGIGPDRLKDFTVRLVNDAGTSVKSSNPSERPPGTAEAITYTPKKNETLYLHVDQINSFTGDYAVSMTEGDKASYSDAMGLSALTHNGGSWANAFGQSAVVTWGFRKTAPISRDADGNPTPTESTFQQISDVQKDGIRLAFQAWSDICGITFLEIADDEDGYSDSATILLANYADDDGSGGFSTGGVHPANNGAGPEADIYLNSLDLTKPIERGAFDLVLHEIGHSIGLDHPGDYNAGPGLNFTYDADAGFLEDSRQYTVLSYFGEWETGANFFTPHTLTPMMYDIAAAQYFYGAPALHEGNTVYGANTGLGELYEFDVDPSVTRAMVIYDTGGTDTIDASFSASTVKIDLRPGRFSSIDGTNNVAIFSSPYLDTRTIIENAIGGAGNDTIIGNTYANTLTGGEGNDTLDGGGPIADTLIGGKGDDTYDNVDANDTIIENAGEGIDTLLVRYSYTLPTFKSFEIIGAAASAGAINLTGNVLAQTIRGNNSNNVIDGAGGNDTLEGKGGNDLYYVNQAGVVVKETSNGGSDTVVTSVSYVLDPNSQVEFLYFNDSTSTAPIKLTGSQSGQEIVANAGNNIIDGKAGADILKGLGGDDIYRVTEFSTTTTIIEAIDGGNDRVDAYESFTLSDGAYVERIRGLKVGIYLEGNDLVQTIFGTTGDDTLRGGGGADILIGGEGDDRYFIDNLGVTIKEESGRGSGVDTIIASIDYKLQAGLAIERLEATTQQIVSLRLTGNELDQTIRGYTAGDTLAGGGGADILDGGGGVNTYIITSGLETIIQGTGSGHASKVLAYVDYALGADYSTNFIHIMSGELARRGLTLTGNELDQTFIGSRFGDTLHGGGGKDTFTGGAGNDVIYVDSLDDSVMERAREGIDTVYASLSYKLAAGQEIEQLRALPASGTAPGFTLTGNEFDQEIVGTDAADVIIGGGGGDTLIGLKGNDRYYAGARGDAVIEAADGGDDTVFVTDRFRLGAGQFVERLTAVNGVAAIEIYGNEMEQEIDGNAGNNRLDGGGGGDIIKGNAGNDSYIVNDANVRIYERTGQGSDAVFTSVNFVLPTRQEIEVLSALNLKLTTPLSLKGNAIGQQIIGNAGANTLDGGGGGDTLAGGKGDDTYLVNDDAVAIAEASGQGFDTVLTTVDYWLSELASIEEFRAANPNATSSLFLGGNFFAQHIVGNAGNNELYGGGGADALEGLQGNDLYHVDNANDTVTELVGGGTDTVRVSVNFTLRVGDEVEVLETFSRFAEFPLDLTGNDFAQRLNGSVGANKFDGRGGNDVLQGDRGVDTLTGGSGVDTFIFAVDDSVAAADSYDTITDFLSGTDRVDLSVIGPGGLPVSAYAETVAGSNSFAAVSAAASSLMADGSKRAVFVAGTVDGWLFWNTDGDATDAEGLVRLAGLNSLAGFAFADLV